MSITGVRTSGAGSRDSHRQATPVIPATPAPGSLRAILLKNCTTRLFVHQLEWTADHIEALDVDLVTSAGKEEERITDETKRQVDERIHLLEAILDLEHTWASSRDAQIREIFPYIADAANITQQDISESILYFEYDKFSVARLPPVILACYQSTTNPIWAYTDRMWTSAARRKRYYARKKSYTFTTKKIKSKQELAIDPIYIAMLITMAQLKKRHGPQESKIHSVTLFVPEHEYIPRPTNESEPDTTIKLPKYMRSSKPMMTKLIQYTANITSDYLRKFEEPYKFYNAGLQIEKRTLPLRELALILTAMKTAFHGINGCGESPLLALSPKRKPLEELDPNTEDEDSDIKRRKV